MLIAANVVQLLELILGSTLGFALLTRQPGKLPVVEHHRMVIAAALDIAFDTHSRFDRQPCTQERILRYARAVQSAMGISPPRQPVGRRPVKPGKSQGSHQPLPDRKSTRLNSRH